MTCIWCKRVKYQASEEHIFPESLGCPAEYVLSSGEVCKRCNTKRLSKLDQSLVSELEMIRFLANVPNKKGQPPSIATQPNVRGAYLDDGPHLYINSERYTVDSPLGPIGSRRADSRFHVARWDENGDVVSVRIAQDALLNTKRSARGLHKIALELLCHQYGNEVALEGKFDPVRNFVIRSDGDRRVLIFGDADYINRAWSSKDSTFGMDVVAFQLTVVGCMVDLSPKQEHFEKIVEMGEQLLGKTGWSWIPIPTESS